MVRPLVLAGIGLSVLLMGALNPIPVRAETPIPEPISPSANGPTGSTSYSLTPEDFSITVTPTRLIVGQAEIASVQKSSVINRGQASASVTVQRRNFTVGTDGTLSYLDDPPYAASEWLTINPTQFTLAPGEVQVVTTTIAVPAAPEPGDHQVALVFMVPAGETDANIKINRGIATPVFITVPGPIDTTSVLSNLAAPGFAINGPVPVTATVTNTGTVHRDFRGDAPLTIDTAGETASFPDFTVPRDSARDISTTWDPPLMCICNPTVQFVNDDGSVQSATVQVIVFPLHMLAIIVGLLLVLWLGMLAARRSYRASVHKAAAALHRPVGRSDA